MIPGDGYTIVFSRRYTNRTRAAYDTMMLSAVMDSTPGSGRYLVSWEPKWYGAKLVVRHVPVRRTRMSTCPGGSNCPWDDYHDDYQPHHVDECGILEKANNTEE